LRKNNIASFL